jgi:Na+-driven multidrug efflux pump
MSKPITGWLGAGTEVFSQVHEYVKIILLGAPFFIFNTAFAFFVRNEGRPTLSMIGMFASIIVDIILNFVFVGAMKMGVAGAAYSTVIGSVVGVVITGSHFLTKKNTLKFRFSFDKMIVRIVKNGGSSALQFVYQFLTILIINRLLSKLAGTNGVVVYTVVFNLMTVSLSLFEGISQTIQPSVSNFFGEGTYANVKATIKYAFLTILIVCGGITVILELVPGIIPAIFGIEDGGLMADAIVAVRIYSIGMIITTINVVAGYYFQSTERNLMAAVLVSLRSFVIFLALVFVLGKLYGINGIWAAYVVTEVVCFVILVMMIFLRRGNLKKAGKNVNFLLLEESEDTSFEGYVFICGEGNYEEFCNKIKVCIEDEFVNEYMSLLGKCVDSNKKKYIGVEINKAGKKIIIRDNLNHDKIKENVNVAIEGVTGVEYGPVLGFNRIFLGGDVCS